MDNKTRSGVDFKVSFWSKVHYTGKLGAKKDLNVYDGLVVSSMNNREKKHFHSIAELPTFFEEQYRLVEKNNIKISKNKKN